MESIQRAIRVSRKRTGGLELRMERQIAGQCGNRARMERQ